ncbi:MAG: glutathione S-transferase N-terminal domain-containing protein [Pseudomonadales bacterium]|jgi:glutathione S-transferase|nr:glutathione S-transferase N-terminal domain-containing protein [Pseudomonadales bacterium]MDP6473188.1 glutathione S-transferase N-terminal domain-containing protein [Pseudomonadales bacterium]MDP6826052.1 glutathione S-transferase N-terminal domain-containing protein [Pseudomonadales bacterium]|tara:strand:- start:117 stop:776 length:660 start_codon:yes stop_codon:yes gene_type:complete
MIELYTAPTPNGWKVSMALEEMDIAYRVHLVDLSSGEQHTDAFRRLNPNGRIPAIVDTDNDLSIFESGAILLYLAEKSGRLIPSDTAGRYQVMQWLMFQMAGIGPMQGQAVSFIRYFPETVQPAIDRYVNESRRLYEVLDTRLRDVEYLADEYSIADIANYSWVRSHKWARVPIDGLAALGRWMDAMAEKPGIRKGSNVPPSPGRADKVKAGGAAIVTR